MGKVVWELKISTQFDKTIDENCSIEEKLWSQGTSGIVDENHACAARP